MCINGLNPLSNTLHTAISGQCAHSPHQQILAAKFARRIVLEQQHLPQTTQMNAGSTAYEEEGSSVG